MSDKTQKSLRILMVRNAYSYDFGGGERFPVDTSVVLNDLGHQTVVVSRNSRLLDYAQKRNIETERGWWWSRQNWGGPRVLLLPVFLLWQITLYFWYLQLFVRHHPDVVHLQSRDDFIAGTIAARIMFRKVIWTDHADLKYVFANHQTWYKNPLGKLVYLCSRLANTVTLVSDSERKLIADKLGRGLPGNYRVIHNGVSSTPVTPVTRDHEYTRDVIFGSTSRLVTAKGIGELITAFKQTQVAHPKSRLFLFGEGPEEAQFKKLAEDNARIHFMGFPADSLNRLADCDVFVHASYHEGFSLSLIEAAKLGLPIIACAVGGNTEIVRDEVNGLLIPAKDASALAEAMTTLAVSSAKRRKLGIAARQTYQDSFISENLITEKLVPLYE